MIQVRSRPVGIVAALAILALAFAGITRGGAQEATPVAAPAAFSFPNHIHAGTCETLDPQPLVTLAPLEVHLPAMGDAAAATPVATTGASSAVPAIAASTRIDLALADILAADHAINVHDAADPSIYIACGAIGGTPDEQGNLFVGLLEQNDSGASGVAWLLDDGSGAGTTVTVFLFSDEVTIGNMMGGMMATPVA
jgi:hypothetical protein